MSPTSEIYKKRKKNKAEEMRATIGIQPAEEPHILSLAKETLSQQQEKCQAKLLCEEARIYVKVPV